jgi:tight adherence protein C
MFGIPLVVWVGAAMVGVAIPLTWWSISSAKSAPSMTDRLHVPNPDLREIVLSQNANERVVQPGFKTLARWARAVSPVGVVDRLEKKIVYAGLAGQYPVELVLAFKLILGAFLGMLFLLRVLSDPGARSILFGLILPISGFILPDLLIGMRANQRQDEIQTSLPDVLDQITIAVEAGLGFEAALGYVANNIVGPLGDEISHTLQDIRVGFTRAQAFDAMVKRTDVDDLRQFVLALRQAEKLGIPIAQVLRSQSEEMRVIRKQRAEENAQKLPVKMIIPLVVFILPALVIVVLAPAVFDAIDTFGAG